MKTELKKLPKSKISVQFELDEREFLVYLEQALEHLKRHTKMNGFRPGSVPKDLVQKRVGSENLLMEAGDLAVKESYLKFVKEQNLEPVGQPEIKILKIAKGSPMQFEAIVEVLPQITLPDYRGIAAKTKVGAVAVEEKEIDEAIAYLQKSRAKFIDKTEGTAIKDYIKIEYQNEHINGGKAVRDMFIVGEGAFLPDFENNLLGMKVGEEKEFAAKFPENAPKEVAGKEGNFKVKMLAVQIMELAEINDEFAKALGMFDNLVALKVNIKEGIAMEKEQQEKMRHRGQILEAICKNVDFDLPENMVAYEQERLLENLKDQIAGQFRISFEEYLKSTNKTEEGLKASFLQDATRRIQQFLVLREISRAENVEVSKEELQEEMNRELKKYPKEQADQIDIGRLREYSKEAVINEKVFEKLEGFSKI